MIHAGPQTDPNAADGHDGLLIPWGELMARHATLRPPVIDGLLRSGETMNIIANSKVGKSWLVNDLAMSVATGTPWLGMFPTVPGAVLIIDNELHRETIASRLRAVAAAKGVEVGEDDRSITVWPLRGRLLDMGQIAQTLKKRERGEFSFIIIDAFYRTLYKEMDENSNADMAGMYNAVDGIADSTGAATALIHHASKGNQSEKSVTDVGSGAGAISRAADTHLILRKHQEDRAFVLDLALRSWAPRPPLCLRWRFPQWEMADDLDPADLWKPGRSAKKDQPAADAWDAERFAGLCPPAPTPKDSVILTATTGGCSKALARTLLKSAIHAGLIEEVAGQDKREKYIRAPHTPRVGA